MTEPSNIKVISANARRVVKYKSTIAIFVIWLFSMLAMVFIFFDNKDFIKMPATQDSTINTITKQQPATVNERNQKDTMGESFVLVQYNKKLILTKYSAIAEKVESNPVIEQIAPPSNENNPVIIKRPKSKPQKEDETFFIKTVPQ
jgi:hypothetical protein